MNFLSDHLRPLTLPHNFPQNRERERSNYSSACCLEESGTDRLASPRGLVLVGALVFEGLVSTSKWPRNEAKFLA